MLVEMLTEKRGSKDGRTVDRFEKGKQYDLPDDLARAFLSEGWAKTVAVKVAVKPDDKSLRKPDDKKLDGWEHK